MKRLRNVVFELLDGTERKFTKENFEIDDLKGLEYYPIYIEDDDTYLVYVNLRVVKKVIIEDYDEDEE